MVIILFAGLRSFRVYLILRFTFACLEPTPRILNIRNSTVGHTVGVSNDLRLSRCINGMYIMIVHSILIALTLVST